MIQDSVLKEVLCRKLVDTNKHTSFHLVFLLVKLVLIFVFATTTIERAFFTMNYIKSDFGYRIGDGILYHCLVTNVKTDALQSISTDAIMHAYNLFHL